MSAIPINRGGVTEFTALASFATLLANTLPITLQADEIEVFGKTTNELGTYTIATRDGKQLDIGSYVVVWKKTSDGWKLHWDIFNSNLPTQK